MVQNTSREELTEWLSNQPSDFAQVIAARAALRVLPFAFEGVAFEGVIRRGWTKNNSIALFRASVISWAARNLPVHNMARAALPAAYALNIYVSDFFEAIEDIDDPGPEVLHDPAPESACAVRAAAHSVYDLANIKAHASDAVDYATVAASNAATFSVPDLWESINNDRDLLTRVRNSASVSRYLTHHALWPAGAPKGWSEAWAFAAGLLSELNQGYSVWIDWYNRRIEGHEAAFNIPGDTDRTEDKAILARLADASGKDFWDKGADYVNTTLQRWIDEARERVAPKETPPQDSDALTYGVNAAGKLDRLPTSDQQHLRDAPDQQRIYRDVREASLELQGEGQRLGARLEKALGRFLASLPENFAAAECYSVWRDGNTLRRIHLAHRAVAGGKDYDDKRLDPAMAEMLGDVLDRYNLFAFGDDGLRAKDEAAIPPQERARAEDEAQKAAPLVDAMLDAPEIMTEIVRDDIIADQADQEMPKGDPYYGQALVQFIKSTRNRIAALLSGVAQQVIKSAKSVREGAEREVGAMIVRAPLIVTFVAANIEAIKTFATTAYANVSLQWLWDALAKLTGLF